MSKELVVAKFGSEVVVDAGYDTNERLSEYARNLLALRSPEDLLIVSSGAVALGSRALEDMGRDPGSFTLQQKAQMGAGAIAEAWRAAFKTHGVTAGGLWVTHHELEDTGEGGSLRRLLTDNRRMKIISIINENDALSETELTEYLYGGDNDGLARHIAESVGASELYLYTQNGGVWDDDKKPVPQVTDKNAHRITAMLQARPVNPESRGRGGIIKKHAQALAFSRSTGTAYIAPPPTEQQDKSKITVYPRAA